jgi:hypothetical protein
MSGRLQLRDDDYVNLAALKVASEGKGVDVNRTVLPYYLPLDVMAKNNKVALP